MDENYFKDKPFVNFEGFINDDVLNFMKKYNLEKITVENGHGGKGVIKINKHGNYEAEISVKKELE